MFIASLSSPALALPTAVDPNVDPNWSFFPFMNTLRDASGGIIAAVLIVMVVILVLGAIMLVASKMGGGRGMSDKGATVLGWAMVGAVIIGSASGIVAWVASIDIGF